MTKPCGLLPFLLVLRLASLFGFANASRFSSALDFSRVAEGFHGAVASQDGLCSDVGVRFLQNGGNAVDASVATLLCLGVVSPVASGIGGGGFLLLRLADGRALAYDMREVAPGAASEDMYAEDPDLKGYGALSVAVPGELAGLYSVWHNHGSLPWKCLLEPAIRLAEEGFVVSPFLESQFDLWASDLLADEGLSKVFAPNGTLLRAGNICLRKVLARTLQSIAEEGPDAFYNGSIGENLVADVQRAGGILTMEDIANYRLMIREPIEESVQGLTILGMPPPSAGGACDILIFNILAAFEEPKLAVKGSIGLHRMIEAFKHAFAVRMNLGDPDFVNVTAVLADMLSPAFAADLQKQISDNQTFPPDFYGGRWKQLDDHGTSHLSVVDEERNAVAVTSSINWPFGVKMLSPSTGIILNNEMADFSIPTNTTGDIPPSRANFIRPYKRPLSSMSPMIVVQDGQLLGVLGGSGGSKIITAVAQVFLDVFWEGYSPLEPVLKPKFHHQLIPDVASYENWTTGSRYVIEAASSLVESLQKKGHVTTGLTTGPSVQLIVHEKQPLGDGKISIRRRERSTWKGKLTAVSDVRHDGYPAAF